MANNSILVPLDGSKRAESALRVAHFILSHRGGGTLTILRSLETPRLSAWLPAEVLPIRERERVVVEDYLKEMQTRYQGHGYKIETVLAENADPVDAILGKCSEIDTQLIVMTSHGRSGWVEYIMGSTTEKVLRSSTRPVLVVKPEPPAEDPPFRTIVIPLDGSERSEQAIPIALDLGPGGSAQILLVGVSVIFKGHAMEGDLKLVEPDMKRIEEYLERHASWLSNQGYEVSTYVLRGHPAEKILELTEEKNADLILMTSHARSGLSSWFYGSVAERILRHTPTSVLILKETSKDPTAPSEDSDDSNDE